MRQTNKYSKSFSLSCSMKAKKEKVERYENGGGLFYLIARRNKMKKKKIG